MLNFADNILLVHMLPTFAAWNFGLVIEVDGSQHMEQAQADQHRSHFLEHAGYRVLRFWDNEVLTNTDAVLEQIVRVLNGPHPNPLPVGEGTGQDE
jgi:very-short-patch-repair endonuclease